jgi:hypothetical protein
MKISQRIATTILKNISTFEKKSGSIYWVTTTNPKNL